MKDFAQSPPYVSGLSAVAASISSLLLRLFAADWVAKIVLMLLCIEDCFILTREDIESIPEAVCLGKVYGIVGKFQVHSECDKKLILIRQRSLVGQLPGNHDVYKINKVVVLNLSLDEVPDDFKIEPCKLHNAEIPSRKNKNSAMGVAADMQQRALQKTWNTIKTATANVNDKLRKNDSKDREKFERRITDELIKTFTDTDSFYYSVTGDLTNSIQRQYQQKQKDTEGKYIPLWQRIDDRFFWNKEMLQDLMKPGNQAYDYWILPLIQGYVQIQSENQAYDYWILPLIQGYVQIQRCHLDNVNVEANAEKKTKSDEKKQHSFKMIIISRRSRFRAGTRYKRRGVDDDGKCANYVETEQIFEYAPHIVSFIQVRGSVPVYWSQPGYKYRPPPRLDRGDEESMAAFEKHFSEELSIYGTETVINLVEQLGREKVIADAYLLHILKYNSPKMIYVSFDFHEYCRGMRFENVSVLIESIRDVIRDTRYCWMDRQGLICEQKGAFRVNCIDCLDRTNIVQTALAKAVMDTQLTKLGLLLPEGILPANCRLAFQQMWANNGDIISRQYAGTAALKGDFTRTGERRIAGMMKDGYNSANRYYLNRFKDAYRQAAIDLMIGNPISEDFSQLTSPDKELAITDLVSTEDELEHQEHVKQLIEDCKKMLVPEIDDVLGGWPLIDADPVNKDQNHHDMDIILLLTKDSYYVAEYDDETDRITRYQRILLEDLEKIELGPEASLFKSRFFCMRLHYTVNGQPGYFHTFRSTALRFFNNMSITIQGEEDTVEALKAICETFKVALSLNTLAVPFYQGKLERRKSKLPFSHGGGAAAGNHRNMLASINLELPNFHSTNYSLDTVFSKFEKNSKIAEYRHVTPPPYANVLCGKSGLCKSLDRRLTTLLCALAAVLSVVVVVAQMTRNVSESQLLSLRHVGARALNNVSNVTSHTSQYVFKQSKAIGQQFAKALSPIHGMKYNILPGVHAEFERAQFHVESSSDSEDSDQNKTRTRHDLKVGERTISSEYSDIGSSDFEEYESELTGERLRRHSSSSSTEDALLPSCGILASPCTYKQHNVKYCSSSSLTFIEDHFSNERERQRRRKHEMDEFMMDSMRKAISMRQIQGKRRHRMSTGGSVTGLAVCSIGSVPSISSKPMMPEIKVFPEELSASDNYLCSSANPENIEESNSAKKKLSRSSEYIEARLTNHPSSLTNGHTSTVNDHCVHFSSLSSGEKDAVTKMKSSHSESAIQGYIEINASSPSLSCSETSTVSSQNTGPTISFKRDLVLSPLSKIAKGVQNFGQTMKVGVVGGDTRTSHSAQPSSEHDDEYNRLKEMRRACLTRLIEL
ncbi:Phosphatidylinositide phosphatase SAC2 [Nymphon striatum]|nr:Phosphatidylinositide phosphatase SAC2 [Nymphon striatum]